MRILIVEDEPKTAAYVKKGLMEHGYVVDVASDGLDGLHLATTTEYDLILLDVMLPGIDGWSVLQGVRQQRQTPVLFLSALDQVDDRVKGLKLGADDYLVKPFAFSELLARVQNILRRGAAPRHARRPAHRPDGQGICAARLFHAACRRNVLAHPDRRERLGHELR